MGQTRKSLGHSTCSRRQFVEQRFSIFQIERVEAFSEPAIKRGWPSTLPNRTMLGGLRAGSLAVRVPSIRSSHREENHVALKLGYLLPTREQIMDGRPE